MDKIGRLNEKILMMCLVLIVITAVQCFFVVHDVMQFSYGRSKDRAFVFSSKSGPNT